MKTVQANLVIELTFEQAIENLLVAELQDASCRDWWVDKTVEEAYQKLPREQAMFLEEMAI